MPSTLFKNARLIDPWTHLDQAGDLLAVDGTIRAVGADAAPAAPADAVIIDCAGQCLAPGLVDMRVHLSEPGHEHLEDIETTSRSAVAGGITSLVALPGTEPVLDDVSTVEFVSRRARKLGLVNIYAYGAATRGLAGKELTEMGLLAQAGAVGFTDGGRAIADALVMRRALSYARTFDQLIVQHPEEPKLAAGGAVTEGEVATRLGLPGITPAAELIMVERDLRLVEITGARYHVAHVSTAAAIEAIRHAKAHGLPVSCDTAPAYFMLNETAIEEYRTFTKLSPPLRPEADRRAVVEGLRDGTIDAIASDHHPHDQDSKRLPFTSAAAGIVGLETLLPLALTLHHKGEVPLLRVLRALTQAPADILRLPIGRLAVGAAADLVLFDLDRPHRIRADQFKCKARNTPFDGLPVQGTVLKTFVAGRNVHSSDRA
ncbi:dihydroorotase [Aliidongia dinghuensis]|uniref:Dihydroorotase n=1 Tax=Aliidongia dinghuensis TaxID=1867774 RepID=A0A8J2YYH5_9PROT|nr:dihydroorotase [Aliidongia dinghuensis]GGF36664.1 dihydroorotase [Aliidongia dinghuensis]